MCIIMSISIHKMYATHTYEIAQTISDINQVSTMLQEYSAILEQEIKKLTDEHTAKKRFFDFIWEPEAQKTKRLHIAELRKEHQKIQDTLYMAISMPAKTSIAIYQNMLQTISQHVIQDATAPKNIKTAVLIRATKSRMHALQKTL